MTANTISHILRILYTCTDTEGKILLVTFIDMWISTFLFFVVLLLWYSCRAMRWEECRSWYNEITTIHQHQHQSMHKTSVIYCAFPVIPWSWCSIALYKLYIGGTPGARTIKRIWWITLDSNFSVKIKKTKEGGAHSSLGER